MKINFFVLFCFFLQITLHYLEGETVFKFYCCFSFPQRLGGVQDSDHSIYEMIKKRRKKKQTKKISVMVLYFFLFFLPWLFTALQVEIQFALGKGLRLYMNI